MIGSSYFFQLIIEYRSVNIVEHSESQANDVVMNYIYIFELWEFENIDNTVRVKFIWIDL